MPKRRRPERRRAFLLGLLAAVGILSAVNVCGQGVVLHLRNGDKLTGTIRTEDTNHVVLRTTWAEGLSVPVSEIVKRESVAAGPPVAATNQAPARVAVPAVPAAPVVAPSTTRVVAKSPKHWAGDIQVGADLLYSEKKQQIYTSRIKATYTHNRFRNLFDYLFSYGRTDGIVSANRMEGSSKTDFDLIDRVYVYNLAGAGYDEIRRVDIRYDIGPGVGYHLVKATNFVLNTEVGVNYRDQYLADDTRDELFYHRFAEDFTWKITSRLSVDEKFEFLPRVGDWGTYRFRLEANLRYLLRANLYLNIGLIDQYDTDPARSVDQNDLQVRSALGLKF